MTSLLASCPEPPDGPGDWHNSLRYSCQYIIHTAKAAFVAALTGGVDTNDYFIILWVCFEVSGLVVGRKGRLPFIHIPPTH